MQIWAESGKSALPICNYSQILYQFLIFTQNLKRSRFQQRPNRRQFDILIVPVFAGPACYMAILLHAGNQAHNGRMSNVQKGFDFFLGCLSASCQGDFLKSYKQRKPPHDLSHTAVFQKYYLRLMFLTFLLI